jgi:hypothetical protein
MRTPGGVAETPNAEVPTWEAYILRSEIINRTTSLIHVKAPEVASSSEVRSEPPGSP